MIVIGLMSGTSADGIDAAAARLEPHGGDLVLTPLGHRSVGFSRDVREALLGALPPAQVDSRHLCRLDAELGQAFGEAAAAANTELAGGAGDLVVSHGQTVFHWVDKAGRARGSLQLGQPAWIAEATGLPVLADLRNRDIAAGGQGAPLVAYPDALLLATRAEEDTTGRARALLNLGGIANVTLRRPTGECLAFDTGPGNALVDAAVQHATDGRERCDRDGRRARRGTVDESLLAALLDDAYYRRPPPKSTGKEHFNAAYLAGVLSAHRRSTDDDVVATLTALTAETIAQALARDDVSEITVSGGGTANPALMAELADRLAPARLRRIDELGIPADAKEAYWFAVLGFCSLHGVPAVLPSCTGARRASLLGQLTPGTGGFAAVGGPLPKPRRLRLA